MTTTTLTYTGTLIATSCWCGIGVAIPSGLYDEAQRDHKRAVYCPLGHTFVFGGDTELQREQRLRKQAEDRLFAVRAERDQVEASLRATKGVVTKLRKRVTAGTCPFGCHRHFADLERHVATKHPNATLEGEA